MDTTKTSIGKYLRNARKRAGMSLVDVGDAVGVSASAVSRYERGDLMPKRETRERLSVVLNIPRAMLDIANSDHDMTLPTVISLWTRLSPDDRVRVVEVVSGLASKNIGQ